MAKTMGSADRVTQYRGSEVEEIFLVGSPTMEVTQATLPFYLQVERSELQDPDAAERYVEVMIGSDCAPSVSTNRTRDTCSLHKEQNGGAREQHAA